MSALDIILIAVVALLLALLIGGFLASRRRAEANDGALLRDIAAANEALANARAEDRGWDRDTIDAAAREAHLARRPDARIAAVHIVQVIDRPGVEDDEARVVVTDDAGDHEISLGRAGGEWGPARPSGPAGPTAPTA